MARVYTTHANEKIKILLQKLVDAIEPVCYGSLMENLGQELGKTILSQVHGDCAKLYVAGTVEDADYLTKGIINRLEKKISSINFACFWNHRVSPFGIEDLSAAPILRKYFEPVDESVDYLIVAESLMSDECVVKTNLSYLIETINPDHIFIVTPVIFKGVEEKLREEFEEEVNNKFQFVYFAKDDVKDEQGNVFPGIGGVAYQRLGFVDQDDKNKFTPEIVKVRRAHYIAAKKALNEAVEEITKKLYDRLKDKGLPRRYVDTVAMPDGYMPDFIDTPRKLINLASSLARKLRLNIQSILQSETPIQFLPIYQKFKLNKGIELNQVNVAAHLCSAVAEIVSSSVKEPYKPMPLTALEIRNEILKNALKIDLDSLINYCWKHRLPVVHFDKFPKVQGVIKPSGVAANIHKRPVIVVGSSNKNAASLLFIIAHELGHIVLNHIPDGILFDDNLEKKDRCDEEEKAANNFAVELLFGNAQPYLWKKSNFSLLKHKAQELSDRDRVDVGAILLNYAWHTNDWGIAHTILNSLNLKVDPSARINIHLKQYLDMQNLDKDSRDYLYSSEVLAA
jgi:hypothetical protein